MRCSQQLSFVQDQIEHPVGTSARTKSTAIDRVCAAPSNPAKMMRHPIYWRHEPFRAVLDFGSFKSSIEDRTMQSVAGPASTCTPSPSAQIRLVLLFLA